MDKGFWCKVFTDRMPFLSPNQQRQGSVVEGHLNQTPDVYRRVQYSCVSRFFVVSSVVYY